MTRGRMRSGPYMRQFKSKALDKNLSCRPDMAMHVLNTLRSHCAKFAAECWYARRAVFGSDAIRAHARQVQQRLAAAKASGGDLGQAVQGSAAGLTDLIAFVLPLKGGGGSSSGAWALAHEVHVMQMLSPIGDVAVVGDDLVAWDAVAAEVVAQKGCSRSSLPENVDYIAVFAGTFCKQMFTSFLRLDCLMR